MGLTKEPSDQPIDLKAIWEKVQKKKREHRTECPICGLETTVTDMGCPCRCHSLFKMGSDK